MKMKFQDLIYSGYSAVISIIRFTISLMSYRRTAKHPDRQFYIHPRYNSNKYSDQLSHTDSVNPVNTQNAEDDVRSCGSSNSKASHKRHPKPSSKQSKKIQIDRAKNITSQESHIRHKKPSEVSKINVTTNISEVDSTGEQKNIRTSASGESKVLSGHAGIIHLPKDVDLYKSNESTKQTLLHRPFHRSCLQGAFVYSFVKIFLPYCEVMFLTPKLAQTQSFSICNYTYSDWTPSEKNQVA